MPLIELLSRIRRAKYFWRWLLVVIVAVGFYRFLMLGFVAGTDWYYPNPLRFNQLLAWPNIFAPFGLNGYLGSLLPLGILQTVFAFLTSKLLLSKVLAGWLMYYLPSILLPVIGMWILVKRWTNSEFASFVAALTYLVNTYYLTILVGGQLGVAVAYSLIPWVVIFLEETFLESKDSSKLAPLYLAVILSIQGYYEARFLVITGIVIVCWLIFNRSQINGKTLFIINRVFLSIGVFALLSWLWICGTFLVSGTNIAPLGYDSPNWLSSLSYATWQNTLALHHVWWPPGQGQVENIISILYVIPIIIIGALFWAKKHRRRLGWLVLVSIVGIWLAKGVNPPWGESYRWLFTHSDLFVGFRDPAKFFSLIAFGYAAGLGISVNYIVNKLGRGIRKRLFIALLIIVWLVAFWPLWSQQTSGAFVKKPIEYHEVNKWFADQNDLADWYRVFWWPTDYRGLDFDPTHAVIQANDSSLLLTAKQNVPGFRKWLETGVEDNSGQVNYVMDAYGVRYLAVPADLANELYGTSYEQEQDYYSRALSEGLSYSEVANITDESNLQTYVYKNTDTNNLVQAVPVLFAANSEDNWLLSDYLDSAQNEATMIYDRDHPLNLNQVDVAMIMLSPEKQPLTAGALEWQFTVSEKGVYDLYLPEEASFLLDGEAISSTWNIQIRDELLSRYEVTLDSGSHSLNLTDKSDQQLTKLELDGTDYSGWVSCRGEDLNHLANYNQNNNDQYFSQVKDGAWQSSTDNARCLQIDLSNNHNLSNLYITGLSEKPSDAYLYINFVGQYDQVVPMDELDLDRGIVIDVKNNDYQKIVVAVILPSSAKESFQLDSLSIKALPINLAETMAMVIKSESSTWTFNNQNYSIDSITQPSFKQDSENIITVQLEGNGVPYSLILANQYHPKWALLDQNNEPVGYHFQTGIDLNGWRLSGEETGSYKIVFKPYYNIVGAGYITLGSWILVLLYILVERRRK